MPGILPMKVIKVGSSTQSRIAQACDRCRSKKIRCDGIRPCCTQCANVGFECKTSDKLSRRAFPRGYTESLEERVRVLEAEVRDLKDLLDEKDEKIDMLSKMHGNHRRSSVSAGSGAGAGSGSGSGVPSNANSPVESRPGREPTPLKEDTFKVQASPLLLGVENSDSYFMGPSSGRGFVGKAANPSCQIRHDPTLTPNQRHSSASCKRPASLRRISTPRASCISRAVIHSYLETYPCR
jgi:hypothetical protein